MPEVPDRGSQRRLVACTAPFVLYLALTSAAASYSSVYPLAYTAAVAVVGGATVLLLRGQQLLRPHARVGEAIVFGLLGIALWIGLSSLRIEEMITAGFPAWLRPKPRVGFDPFTQLPQHVAAIGFIAVRLIGLVVVTPLAEELFWRGFLLRWFISADWEKVPIGSFRFSSFLLVTLLFTSAHPEWLAAACYCAWLNLLVYRTRDLWSCVVAHAVSNLALAGYVLWSRAWWLW